jgi:hypothetical protein
MTFEKIPYREVRSRRCSSGSFTGRENMFIYELLIEV